MENIIFRTEIGRELTFAEIDNNFRYVSNPWEPTRIYISGMIIYHDIITDKYSFYRANKTTTLGSFIESEWDHMNATLVNLIESTETTIENYILNDWTTDIKIGDYVKLDNDFVYLLFQNSGSNSTDYVLLSSIPSDGEVLIHISDKSTLQDYISLEWDNTIILGNILLLNTISQVWILFQNDGSSINDYILISSGTVLWNSISGKPGSTPALIDSAVALRHTVNKDTILDSGGTNQITAAQLKTHLNDATVHFTAASLVIDHTTLSNRGTNTHIQIDTHIADSTLHFTKASISHNDILLHGTLTHTQIDTHITGAVKTHAEIDTHLTLGTITHDDIDSHINDSTIHFTENGIDHNNLSNSGTITHSNIDSHINSSTIHYTQAAIDHRNILYKGTNTHAQIDSHIANTSIHLTELSIDHDNIANIGLYQHYEIDSHIDDTSIHFTVGGIIHDDLFGVGYYNHSDIDGYINDFESRITANENAEVINLAHRSDSTIHFTMGSISILTSQISDAPIITSNGLLSAITLGVNNSSDSDNSAIIGGHDNTLDGSAINSVIIGGNNITGTLADTIYGNRMELLGGQLYVGNYRIVTWSGVTTNSTLTEMFLADLNRYIIGIDTAIMFRLDVCAFNKINNVSKIMEIRGGIKRNSAGLLSLTGSSLSTFVITEDSTYDTSYSTENWQVSVAVDNTNKSLQLKTKGEIAKTINWNITGLITITT